ncbi:MAG TPA: hypothetical protein VK897_07455 [Anaerolineales bacterium]|nr:hypothetical protein [Anaerolineales bacterium]
MNLTLPSRPAFWRFIFGSSALLLFLSLYQMVQRVDALGVDLSASRSWMGLVAGLSLLALLSLLFFALTWSRYSERLLALDGFLERVPRGIHWIGLLLFTFALVGFTIAFMVPFIRNSFGGMTWVRFLVFWILSLIGMWGIKMLRPQTPWFIAWMASALSQSTLHLLLIYWSRVTDYPFAMGWSETSRYYHPSFFFSNLVYGQRYHWPIQNPSLHLLLSPPYLFDAPLWFHRFWQVALRYVFVAAVVPAMLKRLSIPGRAARWLVGLWMFLYLFMGPIYFHLTIPVILVLLAFSPENDRRTWMAVLLASFWCGWSRVNWYPMPGIIAAILYLMEVPLNGKKPVQYLLKPALWFVVGTFVAFLSQRLYIALSGVADPRLFYTSFISDLLWYRLWPNSSFSFGILPGIIWTSLPMWVTVALILWARKGDWHPLRLLLIFAAIFVICIGGMIVSLKIGGGANLHNMDAYFILLLIFTAYLVFARYRTEQGTFAEPVPLHWLLVVALLYSPVTTFLQFGVGFKTYEPARTHQVLTSLQEYVDAASVEGGEILFITQRHLISMGIVDGVALVPEYEREDLMEMAMSNNTPYLEQFKNDMETQRFALIVVDPLKYNLLTRRKSFSEENNVWVRRVMKDILCNYREAAAFPEDEIAIYVPQEGTRQCP